MSPRVKLQKPSQPVWYSLVVILVCLGGLIGGGYLYIASIQKQWCGIIIELDKFYSSSPSQDPRVKNFAKLIHERRQSLHCPNEVSIDGEK